MADPKSKFRREQVIRDLVYITPFDKYDLNWHKSLRVTVLKQHLVFQH
jgi:hypothetical protein